MTNVEALKALYVALGGTEDDFTAQTNAEAIAQIATVVPSAANQLPAVTAEDNGKILTVVDGAWAAVEAI